MSSLDEEELVGGWSPSRRNDGPRVPRKILSLLCELGDLSDEQLQESERICSEIEPFDYLSRLSYQWWEPVTRGMAPTALRDLTLGLAKAERRFRSWQGGSGSSVIWTYHLLLEDLRFTGQDILKRVQETTSNPYFPGPSHGQMRPR